MTRLRTIIVVNCALPVFLAWRIHQGWSVEGAKKVGLLTFIFANTALGFQWFRTRDSPKALPSEEFPWRECGRGCVRATPWVFLCVLMGWFRGADLVFLVIFVYGGGTLMTIAFWLWDRRTLRRHSR